MISPPKAPNPNQFGGPGPMTQAQYQAAQSNPYALYGGYGGYQPPLQARAAYPVGGGAGGGAVQVRNVAQPANPFTQSGNGPAGRVFSDPYVGQHGAGGYGGQYGGYGGGYGGYGGQYGAGQGMYGQNGNAGGGYPVPSMPGGNASSGGIAEVGSLIGAPQLPNNAQTLANYPNYQADQTFSQAGGPEYMMRQYGPRANQGMLPSASTQARIAPLLADRGVNANLAKQQAAYDLANQNANALLQWQALGAGSDIGQFNNLAGLNNAQQNFLLGQYGNNVGYQNGLLNAYSGLMGNMLGNVGGMAGGLVGGLSGAASDPNSLPFGLGSLPFQLGGSGGYSDPTGALSSIMGGAGAGNPLLASLLGGATG